MAHEGIPLPIIQRQLGHADVRSTQPYLHADLAIKEKALVLVTPPTSNPAATSPQTRRSRSSRAYDYADTLTGETSEKPTQPRAFNPTTATMSA